MILKCGDRNLPLGERSLLMGILNVTPDSFSDGGQYASVDDALKRAHQLLEEGADIIDIGGESTRPGAQPVKVEQELSRVLPVVKELTRRGIRNISIDTRSSLVADACLAEGASWINDVSAMTHDKNMLGVARNADCVVIMHCLGTPETMQSGSITYQDVVADVANFLKNYVAALLKAGYSKQNIIVDPGIGFGKSLEHNRQLSRNLSSFSGIGAGVLYGPSRKAFIGEITGIKDTKQRDNATLAAIVYAALTGANIVRVHNIKAAREALLVADWLNVS